MIMEVTFEVKGTGTRVTILFKNIPSDIRPEDNEAGTKSSLKKLAGYVE
jgi:Activator of Hsp90 ATPase homolog 1-like protein